MESYRVQLARLYERSPFYRNKLQAAGFASPQAAGGLERIAELPFTEKDELRASQAEHPPLGAHAAVHISEVARVYSTSGTSGTPLYIPLTRNDVEQWREIGRRTYSCNGLKAGERVVTTYGAGPFVAGASLAAFEAIGTVHIPVGVGNTDKLLAAVERLRPEALACTPSYALHIAEVAARGACRSRRSRGSSWAASRAAAKTLFETACNRCSARRSTRSWASATSRRRCGASAPSRPACTSRPRSSSMSSSSTRTTDCPRT